MRRCCCQYLQDSNPGRLDGKLESFLWALPVERSASVQKFVTFWLSSLFSATSQSPRTITSSWLCPEFSSDFRWRSISAWSAMSVNRKPFTWTLTVTLIGVGGREWFRDPRKVFISKIRNFFETNDLLRKSSRLSELLKLESWKKVPKLFWKLFVASEEFFFIPCTYINWTTRWHG